MDNGPEVVSVALARWAEDHFYNLSWIQKTGIVME